MEVVEGNHAYKSNKYPFKKYITVRTQFRGFHAYEKAPDQVAFLKANHRHVFKVEATISVEHDDRELEFFMVQDNLDKLIVPFVTMKSNLGSCEQLAEQIATGLINLYGTNRHYTVRVSEDGENDGVVQFDRDEYVYQQFNAASKRVEAYRWVS